MLAKKSRIADCIWQGERKTNRNVLFSLWSLEEGENSLDSKERKSMVAYCGHN